MDVLSVGSGVQLLFDSAADHAGVATTHTTFTGDRARSRVPAVRPISDHAADQHPLIPVPDCALVPRTRAVGDRGSPRVGREEQPDPRPAEAPADARVPEVLRTTASHLPGSSPRSGVFIVRSPRRGIMIRRDRIVAGALGTDDQVSGMRPGHARLPEFGFSRVPEAIATTHRVRAVTPVSTGSVTAPTTALVTVAG
jgi:hypothetical protein